ncbi:MSMEG_0570 family nitrogen starvation response protein [Gordonia sp. PKS22-38]|uniref:MSMEG_0570 family nitrogen starvation response protein n=1 Tax=Gordonia prachuapensis TaxID=3115651 RepID=A0ABU7N081_9ACTN|nr:MSMEG_0570 family nitrogen starvation response protein [Gordonia sp. PKS22-38]
MPEMTVTVRWPDGQVQECYSPSLVMHDHLDVGGTYAVDDFTTRATTALAEAAERVRAKFGFACTSAAATADDITRAAQRYDADARVEVLRMHPPLPTPSPLETP